MESSKRLMIALSRGEFRVTLIAIDLMTALTYDESLKQVGKAVSRRLRDDGVAMGWYDSDYRNDPEEGISH